MPKILSLLVLVALAAGLAAGAWIQGAGGAALRDAAVNVEAVGATWLNALRMTVAPLIFSLIMTAIASVADAMATGRLAGRAIVLFTVLLFGAGAYSVAASQGLLAYWPVDEAAGRALIAGVAPSEAPSPETGGFAAWLQGFVPANVMRAAAEDAVLPLVVFAVLFGFAATRLPAAQRDVLVNFFRAVADAMVVIVHWVLLAAPVGVFALALGVGLHAGFGAAGVLLQYVTFVSAITLGITLVAYVLAAIWGGVGLFRFAGAIAPAQVVAVSTQSSIATLPAMLECARESLGVEKRVTDLILPLAVAVFRFTSPVANLAVAFFVAHLHGIEPSLLQVAGALFVAYAVSIASVGLPGQVSFIASVAPICIALGLPLELLGILLAVEVIPDIFRTLGNVTGDLAVTTMLRGRNSNRQQELRPSPLAGEGRVGGAGADNSDVGADTPSSISSPQGGGEAP